MNKVRKSEVKYERDTLKENIESSLIKRKKRNRKQKEKREWEK